MMTRSTRTRDYRHRNSRRSAARWCAAANWSRGACGLRSRPGSRLCARSDERARSRRFAPASRRRRHRGCRDIPTWPGRDRGRDRDIREGERKLRPLRIRNVEGVEDHIGAPRCRNHRPGIARIDLDDFGAGTARATALPRTKLATSHPAAMNARAAARPSAPAAPSMMIRPAMMCPVYAAAIEILIRPVVAAALRLSKAPSANLLAAPSASWVRAATDRSPRPDRRPRFPAKSHGR